jgi:hypothetical protein
MRLRFMVVGFLVLAGCQSFPGTHAEPQRATSAGTGELVLTGEFDNHEQVESAGAKVAVPRVHETFRLAQNDRAGHLWLWRLQSTDGKVGTDAAWLYRIAAVDNGARFVFTPFRPLDNAAAQTLRDGKEGDFSFDAKQWAELTPCALTGERKNGVLIIAADAGACSALLPGLGATAALLPLKLTFDGDLLTSTTFSDQARGADASIASRRVRWFGGWSAINGAGRNAKAESQDWHTHQDLRLSSEGGKIPLRWRDSSPSGYSLELMRRTYAERKLSVLQLNVIEDASGQVIDYVWADPTASIIGINLGWLQVGLTLETAAK